MASLEKAAIPNLGRYPIRYPSLDIFAVSPIPSSSHCGFLTTGLISTFNQGLPHLEILCDMLILELN